jgi:hypothetical protein
VNSRSPIPVSRPLLGCSRRLPAVVLLLALAASCRSVPPPGCQLSRRVDLPPTPLTALRDVVLLPVGDDFVLAGAEGDEVRWAPLSAAGTLGPESHFTLPARPGRAAPWLGVAGKSSAGDQLLAVILVPRPGAASQLQAVAIAQTAGGAAAPPRVLFDAPAGDPAALRVAMGSSRTGRRAVLAWGAEGQTASPSLLILQADGEPLAPAAALFATPRGPWRCLAVSAGHTDFAVSVVESAAGRDPSFRLMELEETGARGYDITLPLEVTPIGCPAAAPTRRGYVVAYQDRDGTFFSDFDIQLGTVNDDILVGSLRFGGPARQPGVAGIAPMGSEFGLLFQRPSGMPLELWRFDAFGNPQGAALSLPAPAGAVGPAATWPALDRLTATYADALPQAGPAKNQRHYVQIACPRAAPEPPGLDAAAPPGDAPNDGK